MYIRSNIFCPQSGTQLVGQIQITQRFYCVLRNMMCTMMFHSPNYRTQQDIHHGSLRCMIRWVVREVAERAGIRNARELSDKTGLPPTSAYRIWTGKATRTDLATLDKLCTALEVKPGQIFEHVAEPEKLKRSGTIATHKQITSRRRSR